MAYNNFFPTNYQPYQMPQMQNNQPNTFVQWVQGINAAKSFPVAPNTSIPLFDSEANVIYIKSADASGMPSIKILDYVVRDNAPRTSEIAHQGNFATKDDVEYLKGEISSLRAKFERLGNGAEKRKEETDGK